MFEKTMQPIPLNNGERRKFLFFDKDDLEVAIIDYIVEKKRELGRQRDFTARELLKAPWMPTQSAVLNGTWLHSLEELAEKVKRAAATE